MAVLPREDAVSIVEEQAVTDLAPTLTTAQVEAIVDRCARPDPDGNTPDADDWTATYDLNAATAMAWERKAALTATTKFDINIDRQELSRSQVYGHCVAEAKRYRSRIVGTVRRSQPENHGLAGYEVVSKDSS